MGPLENSTEHLYTLAVAAVVDIVVVNRELEVVAVVDIVDIVVVYRELEVVAVVDIAVVHRDLG